MWTGAIIRSCPSAHPDGVDREWFPPLVAVNDDERVYGWEAWAAQEQPGWTVVRSLKRSLEGAGPETLVQLGRTDRAHAATADRTLLRPARESAGALESAQRQGGRSK